MHPSCLRPFPPVRPCLTHASGTTSFVHCLYSSRKRYSRTKEIQSHPAPTFAASHYACSIMLLTGQTAAVAQASGVEPAAAHALPPASNCLTMSQPHPPPAPQSKPSPETLNCSCKCALTDFVTAATGAPRLRVPVRERLVCQGARGARGNIHRASGGCHRVTGRQSGEQAHRASGPHHD